jgi:membrane-bound lytic murein transglycosylase D
MDPGFPARHPAAPAIRVTFGDPPHQKTLEFSRPFKIGRIEECDICIQNEFVSRAHASAEFEDGQWWVKDLKSSNGIFVDGKRVERTPVKEGVALRLGVHGPEVAFRVEARPPERVPAAQKSGPHSVERYFGDVAPGETLGEHTILVRQVFKDIQKKQRWRYTWIVAFLTLAVIASGGYTYYLQKQVSRNRLIAEELFYSMKALDLNIANIEKRVQDAGSRQDADEVARLQKQRRETEQNYDRFLTTLKVYDPNMTPQQRLILRVARIFGECELAMPPAFANEVNNYIKRWQSSGRLVRALAVAKEKGYPAFISREFLEQDLPPQFFYLALQESDFDPYISGPMTRKGYAKGMWQFIPETAVKYGLKIGPLVDFPRADPADDRHHYDRATKAAALYIKDLYRTDAQASGLLVMACYNWGENRVLPLVQSMPPNPRERNFWQLLAKYRDQIPQETYDYVFYIASAAVIGEDPRLFGFNFDDPLLGTERR